MDAGTVSWILPGRNRRAAFTASALLLCAASTSFPYLGWLTGSWRSTSPGGPRLAFSIAERSRALQGPCAASRSACSWISLLAAWRRHRAGALRWGACAGPRRDRAARGAAAAAREPVPLRRPGVERIRDIATAIRCQRPGRRSKLACCARRGETPDTAPGARRHRSTATRSRGQPLMHHLAERGWLCFAPELPLRRAPFPTQIVDEALAWCARQPSAAIDFVTSPAGVHLAASRRSAPATAAPAGLQRQASHRRPVPFYRDRLIDCDAARPPTVTPFSALVLHATRRGRGRWAPRRLSHARGRAATSRDPGTRLLAWVEARLFVDPARRLPGADRLPDCRPART
jgi:hypothetical protein